MAVYVRRKLVSSNTDRFTINETQPLLSIVDRLSMPEVLHDYLNVSIDGEVIPKSEWANMPVTPKRVVFISVVPAGDSGGKNPLAAIAMIALSVFTMGAGTYSFAALSGLSGTALTVASAGVMFVGALAINALFPPTIASSPSMEGDSAGFHGLEGLRNQSRQHQSVRSIYGTYKVAPDLAAQAYTITNGDTQTLYALYDFGYGNINVTNVLIGNTPIEQYTNNYRIVKGFTSEELTYYKNDNLSESFATELLGPTETRTTPSDESDEAWIDIRFPIGLCQYPETGGIVQHGVRFEVYVEKTDGSTGLIPLQDLPRMKTSHPVVYDVIQAATITLENLYTDYDALNYSLVNTSSSYVATVKGAYSSNLAGASVPDTIPIVVGQSFMFNGVLYTITSVPTPVITTVTVDNYAITPTYYKLATYTSITLDKVIPSGNPIPYVQGQWCRYILDNYLCTRTLVPQVHNATFLLNTFTSPGFAFYRTTALDFVFSMNLVFPSQGEWDIHIKRLPIGGFGSWLDSVTVIYIPSVGMDDKYFDKTDLITIQSVTTSRNPLDLRVSHTVLELVITATDKISGIVDTLNATCKRLLPTYSGGVAQTEIETSNPAWIALDILMGDSNPDPIPASRIDFTAFENWASFCGEEGVDSDDYGVDCNWTGRSTVFERFMSVLTAGRASISMRENKYSVIYENFPTVPSQLITTKNSWGFKGTKLFTKQPHALNVSFIDPLSDWQMVDRIVYADGYAEVAGDGDLAATYFENISMPLCTNSDRAWKAGRYYLAQGKLRPESFSTTMDIENIIAERGDMVELQYDVGRVGGESTRITAISGAVVTLREPVQWAASPDYYLRIRKDDGSQEEIQVISQTDSYTITLNSVPSPTAKVGDLVVYGQEDYVTDQFLVKSVQPHQDLTATLNLVPLASAIAYSDTGTIPDYDPPITPDTMIYPTCLTTVTIEISMYYEQRMPYVDVSLNWKRIATNIVYEIWMDKEGNGNNYAFIDTVKDVTTYQLYYKQSTIADDYNHSTTNFVKVIPVNAFGYKPPLNSCDPIAFILPHDETAPGKPLFFAGNVTDTMMNLTWLPPSDNDIGGYMLKYTSDLTTADWDDTTTQGSIIPYNSTSISVNARVGSYMLKTLDTSKNLSDDFALIRTTIPALTGLTEDTVSDEHTTFPGIKTNVEVVSSTLRLMDDDGVYRDYGVYNFEDIIDLGGIYTSYITSDVARQIINDSSEFDARESDQDVLVQIRTSSANPSIAEWTTLSSVTAMDGLGESDWSGWQTFYAGYFTARYLEFRAILISNKSYITPAVSVLSTTVAIPSRTEAVNDIACTSGGTSVTFASEFKEIPSIGITMDDAGKNEYYTITSQSTTGFDIEFWDGSGSPSSIAMQFDYIAVGIGEKMTSSIDAIDAGEEDDPAELPASIATITNYLLN